MNKWLAIRYGRTVIEAHVVPLCDKRIHTVPMCWCRPRIERRRMHVHNALDGRP